MIRLYLYLIVKDFYAKNFAITITVTGEVAEVRESEIDLAYCFSKSQLAYIF